MKPRKPLREHEPILLCSAKPLLKTTSTVRINRPQFVENRVAIHHRQKIIENDQSDLLAHVFVDFERFETIVRQHDPVSFFSQHLGSDVGHVRFIFDQKNILPRAVRVFDPRTRGNTDCRSP